jgi:hypothetical protein
MIDEVDFSILLTVRVAVAGVFIFYAIKLRRITSAFVSSNIMIAKHKGGAKSVIYKVISFRSLTF